MSVGVAPLPAVGLALGGAALWSRVSLGVEGRVDAPVATPTTGGGQVRSWLGAGALLLCGHAGRLFACALGQAGSLQSSSEGVVDAKTRSLLWLAAGARFGVGVDLPGEAALRLRSDIVADLIPYELQVNGQRAWRAPVVATSLGADVVLHFR
jgi:hypothetical protein